MKLYVRRLIETAFPNSHSFRFDPNENDQSGRDFFLTRSDAKEDALGYLTVVSVFSGSIAILSFQNSSNQYHFEKKGSFCKK
jgi:hypothetical protein